MCKALPASAVCRPSELHEHPANFESRRVARLMLFPHGMKKTATRSTKKGTGKTGKGEGNGVDGAALVRAIELGLTAKVKAALAGGADANAVVRQKYGMKTRPLWSAARTAHDAIVGLLLEAGADTSLRDEYGRTALQHARHVEAARRILDAGAEVDARDAKKRTALHHASEWGDSDADLVKLLLARGADPNAEDDDGKTPFLRTSSMKVRAILKAHGAKGLPTTDGREVVATEKTVDPGAIEVDGGAIAVDAAGNVWVGGRQAIYRWDGQVATAFSFRASISVSVVAAGPDGTMYFASNSGLLVRRGEAFRLYSTRDSELHDDHIVDMVVDRAGRPHILGYDNEAKVDRPISRFDGKGFTLLEAGRDFPAGLEVESLDFDAEDALVLGTRTGVVFTGGKGRSWEAPNALGRLGAVKHLARADRGSMWAGAWRGAHRIEADGKSTYVKTPDGVKALCVDGDVLWIGMSYGGVLRAEGDQTQLFKKGSSGLTADDVEGLALGRDGAVWIAAGSKVFACRDGIVTVLGEDPAPVAAAHSRKGEAEPTPAPAPAPRARKRKLKPLPTEGFVPAAKIPKHVVAAVEASNIAGLPPKALLAFLRPAIGLVITKEAKLAVGASKVGGRPDLATGTAWPTYKGERDRYLPHLFQLNLADVAPFDVEGLLPKHGVLSFFCDTAPDEIEDSRVTYGKGKLFPHAWPEDLVDRKSEDDFVAQIAERGLAFYATWTLPSRTYLSAFAELSSDDDRALRELEQAIHAKDPKGSSTTRMLGWPDSLQHEVVRGPDPVVLLQIDASMKAPKGLSRVFEHWGHGLTHFLVKGAQLAQASFAKASAEVAYT